jgi:hypothetical protein
MVRKFSNMRQFRWKTYTVAGVTVVCKNEEQSATADGWREPAITFKTSVSEQRKRNENHHTARRQLFALQVGFAVAAHLEEELVVLATARVLETNSKAHDRAFELEKRIAAFKSKGK